MTALHPTRRRTPLETVWSTAGRQPFATAGRIACPECGKLFCAAAIITGAVALAERTLGACGSDALNVPVRLRQFFCDHCRHVVSWREHCTPDGRLAGVPLDPEPGYLRGRYVETFLRAHPEAAGVEMT